MQYNLLILSLISVFVYYLSQKTDIDKKRLTIFYILFVALMASIRSLTIQDTGAYIRIFEAMGDNVFEEIDKARVEAGFILFTYISKNILKLNYRVYFFIIALINLMALYKTVNLLFEDEEKKADYRLLALIIYVLTYGYTFNYITLRAGLAFSLGFLALALFKKNRVKSIILFLLAFFFHTSAVFFLVILLLFYLRTNLDKETLLYWLISLIPLVMIGYKNVLINTFLFIGNQIPIIQERFFPYLDPDSFLTDQKGAILRILVLIAIGFVLLESYGEDRIYDKLLIVFLIGLTIYCLFINIRIIGRIVELFTAPLFVLIPYNYRLKPQPKLNTLLVAGGLFYFFISNYRLIS